MPFCNVGGPVNEFELTPGMPRPLAVSISDKARERDGLTTAVLVEAFGYQDDTEKLRITVPKQFWTDFASIPAWARGVVSPFGRHAKAAVIHDWLYAVGEPGQKDVADRVFAHAMVELEVAAWVRELMHSAVSLGGGAAFARADHDWPSTFSDPVTGAAVGPLFARPQAYVGQPHGAVRIP